MEEVLLRVRRTSPGSDSARWQEFRVPRLASPMSVLDALLYVQRELDPSVAFRCACRVGMCGTCGLRINGREGLACRTWLNTLGATVRLEPLRHLPVVRDLVVDPGSFFERYRQAVPYLVPREGLEDLPLIAPASRQRRAIDAHRECIACGLCYSACDVAGMEGSFLGPAALNRAYTLAEDVRDGRHVQRLALAAGPEGVWRCHSLLSCTAVCPKGISPAEAIQALRRQAVVQRVKGLLSGLNP
ncbi:MAG: succinate dehydrogenase/fumarate reductase iron-sulfur subunit [Chloroflexi bacterium]|nr:succinate dehydrogenase/fumarate reductase iron-sulfur subunit [Chloroflexota bacterium]